jgi:hypothetical protein
MPVLGPVEGRLAPNRILQSISPYSLFRQRLRQINDAPGFRSSKTARKDRMQDFSG